MLPERTTTCACPTKQRKRNTTGVSLIGGALIAILPKCPFCILAYSSAITLCGGSQVHAPAWTSWISVTLALLTLSFILYNYKGARTLISALLVIIGSVFIIQAELFTGDLSGYYTGSITLLIGVWTNGSFPHFVRKGFTKLSNSSVLKIRPTHKELG